MKLDFGFGPGTQSVLVPDSNLVGVLQAAPVQRMGSEEDELKRALRNPVGTPTIRELFRPGDSVAIITSDATRPMPTAKVMPLLLDELYAAGIRRENITLVFARATHRPQTETERRRLAGERAWAEICCVDSDPDDCLYLGRTAAGTPVTITRKVAEARRRICLGNVEYHYFAGYSGGTKAIMPGCSTLSAIEKNHGRMLLPGACAGELNANPVRQDLEEAAAICGVDFILNLVLDEHKEILRAEAGHLVAAHRRLCAFLDQVYRREMKKPADIVLASQGGAPKDLNLYQTQKALDNAARAVREGGVIILIGSCREGLGGEVFRDWMTGADSPEEILSRYAREGFRLGAHKAAAIAAVLRKAQVFLVSELEEELVRSVHLVPQPSAQAALNAAFSRLGPRARVLAMPSAGSTLPCLTP